MNDLSHSSYVTECQACGGLLTVQAEQLGHRGRCPICSKSIFISSVRPAERSGEQAVGNFVTTVAVICAHCDTSYDVPADKLGRTGTCKKCGGIFALESAAIGSGETGDDPRMRADGFRHSPGERIGRFTISKHLGSGAFGDVYQARDTLLKRNVAIKLPHAGAFASESRRSRFLREPQAAAGLRHPNIVPIYDAGLEGDQFYIASAFIDGQTLQTRLEENRPNFRQTAHMLIALAEALDYAHGEGIVHRDIKPANIMLDAKSEPLVMDFGLARLREAEDQLTHDGTVLGTPAYMAPEQAAGNQEEVGPASDQYSLGVVLYEMLCGERPFMGPAAAVIAMLIDQEPPSPRTHNPSITRDLETICQKAMAKRPQDRYASCSELADDLRRWLNNEPIQARRVGIGERLVRWVRREPMVAGLAASVLLVLVGGIVASTMFATRANQSARMALAAEQIADDKATEAIAEKERADEKATEAIAEKKRADVNAEKEAEQRRLADKARENEATERIRADQQAADAKRQKDLAQRSERQSIEQYERAESQLYINQIRLAAHTLAANPTATVEKLGEVKVDRREWEWRYLWRLALADVKEQNFGRQRLFSPQDRPSNFSADLVRVIKDDADQLLYVWREHDQLITGPVDERDQVVTIAETLIEGDQLALSPGGIYAAALDTSSDTLTVWPTLRPTEKVHIAGVRGTLPPWGISDDGKWFGIVISKSRSQLRQVGNSTQITIKHGRKLGFIGFTASGDFLVSWPGQIRLYRVADLRTQQPGLVQALSIVGHDAGSRQVAMDSQGKWLAGPARNKGVMRWNTETRTIAQTFSGGDRTTSSLAFTHDGRRLATLDRSGTLRLWDFDSRIPLLEWNEVVNGTTTVCFGPQDRYLFGFQSDGEVAKWRSELPPPDGILRGHGEFVNMLEFSPDGRRLLSSSYDGTAKLWDTKTERELRILSGHSAAVDEAKFQPDGQVIATGSWDHTIRLWDADTGATRNILEGHTDRVSGVAFHPNGKLLASIGKDGFARLWDTTTRTLILTLDISADAGSRITFSPDGKQLAAGTSNGAVVWRTSDWQELYRINAHKRDARFVTFSPDGQMIATSGFDKQIYLTDASTGTLIGKFGEQGGAHTDLVYAVDFSPDGRLLVSASRDKLLKYWDVEKRQLVAETQIPGGFPMVASFFPDGKRVVTSGWDTVIRILDVPLNALKR